jgi:hypothetical protein
MGNFFDDWAPNFVQFLHNTMTGGLSDIAYATQKANNMPEGTSGWERIAAGIDRTVDPGGIVDKAFRETGEMLPDSVRQIAPEAGSTIGGIIGSYVPVLGTAVGAGIGAGIGSKLKGDSYSTGGLKSGVAAGTAYLSSGISDWLSSPGEGVSDAAQMSAEDMATEALKQEVDQGVAESNASILNSYGSLDTPINSFDSTLQAGSGMNVTPQAFTSGSTFQTPEFNPGTNPNYNPMTKADPWYSYDNVKKGLDVAKQASKFLIADNNAPATMKTGGMGTSPVDINAIIEHAKNVRGETGVSKAGKAALFEDFETTKKPDLTSLILGLRDYAKEDANNGRRYGY